MIKMKAALTHSNASLNYFMFNICVHDCVCWQFLAMWSTPNIQKGGETVLKTTIWRKFYRLNQCNKTSVLCACWFWSCPSSVISIHVHRGSVLFVSVSDRAQTCPSSIGLGCIRIVSILIVSFQHQLRLCKSSVSSGRVCPTSALVMSIQHQF